MKKFKNNASDILRRMKHIEEFCDVTLVSDDGEKILAHKVVLASASTLFRKIFLDYEEDKDYQEVNMKDVESKYMNSMLELINNGETEIKLIECEDFINILQDYCVASKESLSEDNEDKTSKTKYGEQNNDSDDTPEKSYQETLKKNKGSEARHSFTQMKAEIYKLRAENKVFQLNYVKSDIKDKEPNKLKKNKTTTKI